MGENGIITDDSLPNGSSKEEPSLLFHHHNSNNAVELLRENSFEAQPHLSESRSFQRVAGKPILYASPFLQHRKHHHGAQQQQHPPPDPPPYSPSDDYSSTSSNESESIYRSTVMNNRLNMQGADNLDELEHLLEDRGYRGSDQVVLRRPFRQSSSPFANFGKTSSERMPRSAFFPPRAPDDGAYPTFLCPRCGTRQREFFTVANVSGHLEGPGSYLALYFGIYVMCSLFIFGLEEGWMPLDCIYFAVITLTTAGLGDFVPTSNANKIICSVFIYFGVACIGLLLGSYIAGMLDDKAYREGKQKQIEACPNCAKLKLFRDSVVRQERRSLLSSMRKRKTPTYDEVPASPTGLATPTGETTNPRVASDSYQACDPIAETPNSEPRTIHQPKFSVGTTPSPPNTRQSLTAPRPSLNSNPLLGSPVTRQILGRQSHTRHISFDVGSKMFSLPLTAQEEPERKQATSTRYVRSEQFLRGSAPAARSEIGGFDSESTTDDSEDSSLLSSSTYSSTEGVWDEKKGEIQNAKYVFLTLRKALVNSMVIIAVGCVGFWLIEGFGLIDSWYFTTVLLTTVGYGDIVPTTKGGKLFATIYILVAGTILLNNMSTISMIPLELRRRRIEKTVLTQFGDQLDDDALRELASGPLVQRLKLSTNRSDGLNECTREMFSLAMLVRLGKVTEDDIRETFIAFRHLDVNNEGVLNSKSIIGGMIKQHRTTRMNAYPLDQTTPPYNNDNSYWYGNQRSAARGTTRSAECYTESSPLVP